MDENNTSGGPALMKSGTAAYYLLVINRLVTHTHYTLCNVCKNPHSIIPSAALLLIFTALLLKSPTSTVHVTSVIKMWRRETI